MDTVGHHPDARQDPGSPDHGCAWYTTDVISSQLSCHVRQAPNPWLGLKLKIKTFKDFVSRETMRLARQAAPGAHRGGSSLPDFPTAEDWLSLTTEHLPASSSPGGPPSSRQETLRAPWAMAPGRVSAGSSPPQTSPFGAPVPRGSRSPRQGLPGRTEAAAPSLPVFISL